MNEEMESLKENDVFELTPPPEGKKTIGSKWVYMIKKNPGGSERYKTRFVARGFSQTKGLDYQETFSLTANITSVHIFVQMVVQYDLTVHKMNVTTAYVPAPMDCEIFCWTAWRIWKNKTKQKKKPNKKQNKNPTTKQRW